MGLEPGSPAPPASDSEGLSHQRFTLHRPRINNSEVQSGKVSPLCRLLLLDDLISRGKPLAEILLVWPPEPGCLRAVLPLGRLWRESLSALERSRAGMWQPDQPLPPKSSLTSLFPSPPVGQSEDSTYNQLSLFLVSAFVSGPWAWGGHCVPIQIHSLP